MTKEEIDISYENYLNEFEKEWMNQYDPVIRWPIGVYPISKEEYIKQR